jgi:hypothetical protein
MNSLLLSLKHSQREKEFYEFPFIAFLSNKRKRINEFFLLFSNILKEKKNFMNSLLLLFSPTREKESMNFFLLFSQT